MYFKNSKFYALFILKRVLLLCHHYITCGNFAPFAPDQKGYWDRKTGYWDNCPSTTPLKKALQALKQKGTIKALEQCALALNIRQ